MKWCRTILVVNANDAAANDDWRELHESYTRAITSIDHPTGSKSLTLRKKHRASKGATVTRNGVKYLRDRFFHHMTKDEGWTAEAQGEIEKLQTPAVVQSYPALTDHTEEVQSMFGGFDFLTRTATGFRAAIEWETGNISSSHRSLNKLAIALSASVIDAGVLILPSRDLYEHLTDRVGNIQEISPYLSLWQSAGKSATTGILAITVVEHDALTDDPSHPMLPVGNDGRAAEGRKRAASRASPKKPKKIMAKRPPTDSGKAERPTVKGGPVKGRR